MNFEMLHSAYQASFRDTQRRFLERASEPFSAALDELIDKACKITGATATITFGMGTCSLKFYRDGKEFDIYGVRFIGDDEIEGAKEIMNELDDATDLMISMVEYGDPFHIEYRGKYTCTE